MKKKIYLTKLLALSLSAVLAFSACHNSRFDRDEKNTNSKTEKTTANEEKETTGNSDSNRPEPNSELNAKDKTFTDEEKVIQIAFDEYLDEEYRETLSYSLVSTHFELMNPEDFGITEFESIWGEVTFGDEAEEEQQANEEALEELKSYDYSALTYEQQITYDTLLAYLENSEALDEYYYFS